MMVAEPSPLVILQTAATLDLDSLCLLTHPSLLAPLRKDSVVFGNMFSRGELYSTQELEAMRLKAQVKCRKGNAACWCQCCRQ